MKRPMELVLVIAMVGALAFWLRPQAPRASNLPTPQVSATAPLANPTKAVNSNLDPTCCARLNSFLAVTGVDMVVPAGFKATVEADGELQLTEGEKFCRHPGRSAHG
jgi:hypothetical protein